MTREEAIAKQADLAKDYDLSYWYGTNCTKCCDVFPALMTSQGFDSKCWYECEVCGKKTEPQSMPWLAREAWNRGEFMQTQMSLW